MSAVIQVFVVRNGVLEGSEMVSAERFVIGSDPSSALHLDDPSVSARHLGVYVHEGRLAIQDLGSHTGTVVNGEKVSGARYVGSREDVAVGIYTLKFKLMSGGRQTSGPVVSSPPAPAPSPAPAPAAASPAAPLAATVANPVDLGDTVPSSETVRPSSTNIRIGHDAGHERTMPGGPPPAPPVTDPPLASLDLSGDDTIVSEPPPAVLQQARGASPSPGLDLGGQPSLQPVGAPESGPLHFNPIFLEEDEPHDDEPTWSLVEALVKAPDSTPGQKHGCVEIVHYRGELIVDQAVLSPGDTFVIGANWSKAIRAERGLTKPIPLVRLRKDGVAEVLGAEGVQGRLLRQGIQAEAPTPGQAAPLVDGEQCSLKVGQERIFVRFAGVPSLLWTPEDVARARSDRRLNAISLVTAILFFLFFGFLSWLNQYRSKSEDVIELGDDGFAEIVVKDLTFQEPEKPKPKPKPKPIKTAEPVPQQKDPTPPPPDQPKTAPTPKADPTPPKEPPKPGLAAALQNIPAVSESAASRNLNDALGNMKAVRVPGAKGGFKASSLTGKGPSAGVTIGDGAGGVATTGINSLIRKDGAAGSMGGKGDRRVSGKVTAQPRLARQKGTASLSKEEIARVIQSHIGEIQYCYEKQLRSTPGLAGRVMLEWTVTSSGGVGVVKVATSSLSSDAATRCMMDRVKKWKFPKPKGSGSVTIAYPFVFNTI